MLPPSQVNPRGAEGLYAKAVQWALAPRHDWSLDTPGVMARYVAPSAEEAKDWLDRVERVMRDKKERADAAAADAAAAVTAAAAAENADAATSEPAAAAGNGSGDNDDGEALGASDTSPTSLPALMQSALAGLPRLPLAPDAQSAARTLVLDVCCGTGTIGLTMSRHVKRVVGLELVPAAVEDAKANAALNGVTNTEFVCGRAEQTIKAVLAKCAGEMDMAVAVVDPPRSGLHNDVVTALRGSKLNRIVYVSCNPATLAENVERYAQRIKRAVNLKYVLLRLKNFGT